MLCATDCDTEDVLCHRLCHRSRATQSVADAASGVAGRHDASRTHVQLKNDFTKTGETYVHTSLSLIPNCVGVWYMLLSCELMHLWQRACVLGMSQVNLWEQIGKPAILMFILHVLERENLIQRVFRDFWCVQGFNWLTCLTFFQRVLTWSILRSNETTLGYVAVEQRLANDHQNWATNHKSPLPPVNNALWRPGNFVLRGGTTIKPCGKQGTLKHFLCTGRGSQVGEGAQGGWGQAKSYPARAKGVVVILNATRVCECCRWG